jgi:hypothetical protein
MTAMNMVSAAGGFSGVSFHLRRCPQGVASVLNKKTPTFGSRRSKLDKLTVSTRHVKRSRKPGKTLRKCLRADYAILRNENCP